MKIGTAFQEITPPIPVTMGGYGDRKGKSTGVLDPIYARTITLEDKTGERAVIIACDLIGLSEGQIKTIKENICMLTGIEEERIIAAVTHTHSGPLTIDYPTMGKADEEYVDWLLNLIPGTVIEALNNEKDCKTGWYQCKFDEVGANRRNSQKKAETYLTIFGFTDLDNNLLGALYNYNCHPTVLSAENLMISADYPGAAAAQLGRLYGKEALFVFTNGACGDVSTRFTRRSQDYKEAVRLGSILAGEIIKGLNKIEYKEGGTLSIKQKEFKLDPRKLPDDEELDRKIEELSLKLESLKKKGAAHGEIRIATTALQGARVQKLLKEYMPHMEFGGITMALRIGDGAIGTVPAELFSALGSRIINSSPFKPTMVMGYANGLLGYMPDKVSYFEGGYEALSCRFEPGEGEKLAEQVLSLIRELEG